MPGDRSCEGRRFNLQAARLEFPCRTAHPTVVPWRHEQTWARRSDLEPSAPQRALHTCQIPRDSSHPVDRPRSDGGHDRQISLDIPPQPPPSTCHLAIESRARTHAQFVHVCTPERPGGGIARGDLPMNYRFHVMSPHWTSKVKSEADPRRVPYGLTRRG